MSLLRISRDRDGALEVGGRSWQEDGTPVGAILERSGQGETGSRRRLLLLEGRTAARRERTAARRDRRDQARVRGSRRRLLDDAVGGDPNVNARTSGIYLRADPDDLPSWTGATTGNESS